MPEKINAYVCDWCRTCTSKFHRPPEWVFLLDDNQQILECFCSKDCQEKREEKDVNDAAKCL